MLTLNSVSSWTETVTFRGPVPVLPTCKTWEAFSPISTSPKSRKSGRIEMEGVCTSKSAVTLTSESIVTMQLPLPEQVPPDQPAKYDFESAFAVRVTFRSELKTALHEAPQWIPAGLLVTVP